MVKDVGWNIIREFWGMLNSLLVPERTDQLLGSAVHWWQTALSGTAARSVTVCHICVDILEGSSLFHPLPSGSRVAIVNSLRVWITGKDKVGNRNNTQRGLDKDLAPLGEKPVWDWPARPSVTVSCLTCCVTETKGLEHGTRAKMWACSLMITGRSSWGFALVLPFVSFLLSPVLNIT